MVRWPVRKLARVGTPRQAVGEERSKLGWAQLCRLPLGTGRSLGRQVLDQPAQLSLLPFVARRDAEQSPGGRVDGLDPGAQALARGEGFERLPGPGHEFGGPAGQIDVSTVDVVEGQHFTDQAGRVL